MLTSGLTTMRAAALGFICGGYLLSLGTSMAQTLNTKQYPPDIAWRQLLTPHYQIIFPQEITAEAQNLARQLESLHNPLRYSLPVASPRWPILLNNRSCLGNGYVTLAPRKSVWYTTPAANNLSGSVTWLKLLAVHEGRHMVQFDALNQGFTRMGYYFLGEYGTLLFSALAAPVWFWEGDAVCSETALTPLGRGRLPEFDKELRAQQLSGRSFSYAKAFLGSYRDYAGDYYQLGYLLVSEGRLLYGTHFWERVLASASRRSYNPFAFSRALRLATGRKVEHFYNEAMAQWRQRWQEKQRSLSLTDCQSIPVKTPCYTNYIYPQWRENGRILALKYGYGDLPTLLEIGLDGNEKVITQLPNHEYLSCGPSKVVWSEYDAHPRWQEQVFANLVLYDLLKGERRNLSSEGYYLMAALAPDEKRLAAVKYTPSLRCYLVLMDTHEGREIGLLSDSLSSFIKHAAWSPDGRFLVYVRQENDAQTLTVYDCSRQQVRDLLPLSNENISHPVFFQDYVLYCSPFSGIDNIYAVSLSDGRRYQVTNRPFGAAYPQVHAADSLLVFSDYTVDGYRIAIQRLNPPSWRPIEEVEVGHSPVPELLTAQEEETNEPERELQPQDYLLEPYNPLRNSFNVHSWVLFPASPYLLFGIMSNDILNTTALTTVVSCHTEEKTISGAANLSYAGLFPIISLNVDITTRQRVEKEAGLTFRDRWQEKAIGLTVELPYDVGLGVWAQNWNISCGLQYTVVSGKAGDTGDNGALLPLSLRVIYDKEKWQAARDLQPPWGYYCDLLYRYTPWRLDFYGHQFVFDGRGYLPGLGCHHGLAVAVAYEKQWAGNYQYPHQITFPRGYMPRSSRQLFKNSWNYVLPLCYPDWALGSWFYLKRIHQVGFYDHGMVFETRKWQLYRSVGTELLADFHLFSLPLTITAGVRLAYALDERCYRWDLVIGGLAL